VCCVWFSGAFAKFRKATISYILSVRPSAWKNSAPTERIFVKYLRLFKYLSKQLKFHYNSTGITGLMNLLISIQPLSRFWQEPEPSQATGMGLARCILGKFLGVVCHCFPLPLDIPTFAARCPHVPNNASAPGSERWNWLRMVAGKFSEMTPFLRHFGRSFTCRKSTTWDQRLYFPCEGRHAEDFFFEPANLDTRGQHANH
jgi:hypothetical protein